MTILSGKPFLTNERMGRFFRWIILPLVLIYICAGVITAIRNMNMAGNQYAVVLLSDQAFSQYDYWASPCAFLGAYIPWTHYFNNRNMKVKWVFRAKGRDFEKAIRDRGCQSIVLVGHGDYDCWQATDVEVSTIEVVQMMKGIPKKRGEWLQLTCGSEEILFTKMGELVMEDKKNVYTYPRPVNTYTFVFDALFSFKYLKTVSGSRPQAS